MRLLLLATLLLSGLVHAAPREDIVPTYKAFLQQFSTALQENQQAFVDDPDSYWAMVQTQVVPLWSRRASLEGLATAEKVAALTPDQLDKLNGILDRTVQRYAFEILDSYSGQRFVLNDVVFDDNNPQLAVLDVTAVWDNFPDLDIELMLVDEGDAWRFYNIRYGWFSYIGTKKWSYRRGLAPQRFDAFAESLAKKNRRHFADMCRSDTVRGSNVCLYWQDRTSIE